MVRDIRYEEYKTLPKELQKQLTITKKEMVLFCAENMGDSFDIEQILVSVYNEFCEILNKNTAYCLLAKLKKDGYLECVSSGVYEIKEKQND